MLLSETGSLDKFKFLDQTDDKKALMDGSLDALSAYLTDQPFFFREHQFPVRLFRPLYYGIDFYGDNLFTSEHEIRAHPDRVAAFRRASIKGWEYAMSHPDETIKIIQKYGTEHTPEHLRFEYEAMRELLLPDLIEIGHMNPGRWEHIADIYVQLGQLGPDYSLEGFLYDPVAAPAIEKLKRIVGATLVMFLAAGAAILLLWSFNRRLNKQKWIIQAYNERLQAQLAENMALQAKLRDEAIRDPLTGLFNRRYLEETLGRELSRAGREQSSLSLAMMDIDHFKRLNDIHGHAAGDVVLRSLAALLRDYTRTEDVVCRYGGEEFVVVLPATSLPNAMQRMEQLRAAIESLRVQHEQMVLQNTISIGIAVFPVHGKTSKELLQAADTSLYEAKGNGRNRVVVCESVPKSVEAQ
jgi:diguanylate cyclase (GGDEF)-like protein